MNMVGDSISSDDGSLFLVCSLIELLDCEIGDLGSQQLVSHHYVGMLRYRKLDQDPSFM
jgi:hypothetical protein